MAESSKYKTKQSQELLAYLRTTKGSHVTANDVTAHFVGQGKSIGVATVYRQLDRLVDTGLVHKYHMPQTNGAYFEYIDREQDCNPHCFHCKCQKCGALIHLKCQELEQVEAHLLQGHGFVLDAVHTVFYGTCDNCQN